MKVLGRAQRVQDRRCNRVSAQIDTPGGQTAQPHHKTALACYAAPLFCHHAHSAFGVISICLTVRR